MLSLTIRLSLIALIGCYVCKDAHAADNLYRAQTIVTGQGAANRTIGFKACLEDVLIKVSGALKLAGDPRLETYKSRAGDFVHGYDYHDQMSGEAKRDEQGTRDRPYDLIVDFDRNKIDDVLSALDLKPWLSQRPVLGVSAEMEQGTRKYIVTSDEKQSDLQRESLLAAAAKRGMTITLPNAASAQPGGDVVLIGHLIWNDQDLGWVTEWQLNVGGKPHHWQVRGVTFDEAFRRGIGGAAQILSGNGDPAR
jgi:hypothetical protein